MWTWFVNNKTKISGALIVLIGFLQLSDNATTLHQLMSDTAYAVFNLVMGGIVIVLGFWNTANINRGGP